MGILKKYHRNKIGYNLFKTCYDYSKKQGYLYMQVKTVKEGCYDEYDRQLVFIRILDLKSLSVSLRFGLNGILVKFILSLLSKLRICIKLQLQ